MILGLTILGVIATANFAVGLIKWVL